MKKVNSSDTQNSSITRARESNALTFAQVLAARLDADGGGMRERLADALLANSDNVSALLIEEEKKRVGGA